jgi:hypothetical protein
MQIMLATITVPTAWFHKCVIDGSVSSGLFLSSSGSTNGFHSLQINSYYLFLLFSSSSRIRPMACSGFYRFPLSAWCARISSTFGPIPKRLPRKSASHPFRMVITPLETSGHRQNVCDFPKLLQTNTVIVPPNDATITSSQSIWNSLFTHHPTIKPYTGNVNY